MKKIVPALVLLCLFASILVPVSADDGQGELPPRESKDTNFEDYPDNLVMPEEDGEVVIVSCPDEYEEAQDEGEPLIAPFDPGYDTDEFIGIEEGVDGDGAMDDKDACPTSERGDDANLIMAPNSSSANGGFPLTLVSVLAGAILAVITVIGVTVRRKK